MNEPGREAGARFVRCRRVRWAAGTGSRRGSASGSSAHSRTWSIRWGYPDLMVSYPVLLANLDSEGTNITTLAAKAGVTRQAASQLIREIEARGYLDLRPDPNDGRAVIVGRTARGQRLLRDALDVVGDLEGEYADRLGRERFDSMRQSLSALLAQIDPGGTLSAG